MSPLRVARRTRSARRTRVARRTRLTRRTWLTRRTRPAGRALAAALALLLCAAGFACGALAQPAAAAPGPRDAPQWWFDSWGIPALWQRGITGSGVTIAVIDTGVQASLPELAGKVLPGANFNGEPGDGTTDYDDAPFGHGTAMSSIMVAGGGFANIQGIAPDARILPIAVPLEGAAGAEVVVDEYLDDAIRWAADHGAKIISMSLGGLRDPARVSQPCPQVTQDAIVYAIQKGAIVVAASGNSGELGSPVEEPGVCLGAVSVGAVDSGLAVAPFSSRHPYLTIAAPGVDVASLGRVAGEGYIGNGTSQATALASAAMALVWSAHPDASGRDVVSALLATAQDLGDPGRDPAYGLGFIHPELAVDAPTPGAGDNPVWDGVAPYLSETEPASPAPVPIPTAATATAPPGTAVVGARPAATPLAIVGGVIAAGLAVAILAILALVGIVRRPRRHAPEPPPGPPPAPPPAPQQSAGAQGRPV